MMIHKRVSFRDEVYWYHDSDGDGFYIMLSPLDHYSDSGELLAELHDISFAVIEGDNIMQFGEVIGHVSELIDVVEV